MRQLLFSFGFFLVSVAGKIAQAQQAQSVGFTNFLAQMPKPLPTLKETITAYGDANRMTDATKQAGKEIETSLRLIYGSLLPVLKKRAAEMPKLTPSRLSKEEQRLLTPFRTGIEGISEEGMLDVLLLAMADHHPLPGIGNLSWTKLNPSASIPVQKLFQQVAEMERQFDWTGFAKQALAYSPKFGDSGDEKNKALFIKLEEALKRLPKKKIQEQGITLEIEDPDGAVALLAQYRIDSDQASEQFYQNRYQWWVAQYQKLAVMSRRLDAIAAQANGMVATGADRCVQWAIADLQARMWEAWQKLTTVTQGLFIEAIVAMSAQAQIQQSLEFYAAYKKQ